MQADSFIVEPFSQSLTEVSVSALLRRDHTNRAWEITIVISYAPDQNSIDGNEIDARLIDANGKSMDLLERPSGALMGAGTSLSTSSNARFVFHESESPPGELQVIYRGEIARFKVVPGETN